MPLSYSVRLNEFFSYNLLTSTAARFIISQHPSHISGPNHKVRELLCFREFIIQFFMDCICKE